MRRLPPTLRPGPLTPPTVAQVNDFLGYVASMLGNFSPAAPLQGAWDRGGLRVGIDPLALGQDLLSLVTKPFSPTAISSTPQNNYNPGSVNTLIELTINQDTTFTGWVAGQDGQWLLVVNDSAHTMTLNHQDANSSAANRFWNPDLVNLNLVQWDSAIYLYKAALPGWLCVAIIPDLLQWQGARVHANANQTLTQNANTTITWPVSDYDTASYYSAGSPTKFTAPATGKYRIGAWISFTGDAAASNCTINVAIVKNGATYLADNATGYLGNGDARDVGVEVDALLTSGDYVEVVVGVGTNVHNLILAFGNPTGQPAFWISRLDGGPSFAVNTVTKDSTQISGGSSGNLLYDNAGAVGELSPQDASLVLGSAVFGG